MAYTAPTVNYCATMDGTYTTLTGVQNVRVTRGRQRFQDPFPPTTLTVELIPANSYAVPLAVGQFIDVKDTNIAASSAYFVGQITDVQRSYGIPYNSVSGAAPADRITITATGATGVIGANTLTNYVWASDGALTTAKNLMNSLNVHVLMATGSETQVSGQTYTGAALEAVNKLCMSGQFTITDWDNQRAITSGRPLGIITYYTGGGQAYTFRDTAGSGYRYNAIEYLSSVQNAFTQVQVNPEGLASQSAATGSAPYNTCVLDTYNANTTDAASLASYVLTMNSQTIPVPFMIRSDTAVQSDIMNFGIMINYPLGVRGTVIFRGATVSCVMEGIELNWTQDMGSVVAYFSPTLGVPFILDNTTYGILDTNRLGYP